MDQENLSRILDPDYCDEFQLSSLYFAMRKPNGQGQVAFHHAWEAFMLIGSDGIEKLFEQNTPMAAYAAGLRELGLPDAADILLRAAAMLPNDLLSSENLAVRLIYIQTLSEPLAVLANEFYETTANIDDAACAFVQKQRDQFLEYLK